MDDDVIEEGDDETWFGMGMTKEEEIVARRLWWMITVKIIH